MPALATLEPISKVELDRWKAVVFIYEPDQAPEGRGWIIEVVTDTGSAEKLQLTREFKRDLSNFGLINGWLCRELGDELMDTRDGALVRRAWNKAKIDWGR